MYVNSVIISSVKCNEEAVSAFLDIHLPIKGHFIWSWNSTDAELSSKSCLDSTFPCKHETYNRAGNNWKIIVGVSWETKTSVSHRRGNESFCYSKTEIILWVDFTSQNKMWYKIWSFFSFWDSSMRLSKKVQKKLRLYTFKRYIYHNNFYEFRCFCVIFLYFCPASFNFCCKKLSLFARPKLK